MITTEAIIALQEVFEEDPVRTYEEVAAAGVDPELLVSEGYLRYLGSGLFELADLEDVSEEVSEDV